ncbi:nucleotidyltransferase domain-containing protein [Candidatus Poribacteria bacterium]|nr:nucleotidyltransferase domain-containing protein [Candidatus Poribacteria bacterium]
MNNLLTINDNCLEIEQIKNVLIELKKENKILLAYLFGSYAEKKQHKRSDIDIAIYFNTKNERETIDAIDKILMSVRQEVEILRLDDEDESPFMIQIALKSIPLIEPDLETFYNVKHRILHETERIRLKRGFTYGI